MAGLAAIKNQIEQMKFRDGNRPSGSRPPAPGEIESLEQRLAKLCVSQEDLAKEQAIMKSLSFKSRPIRHTSIPAAHQKTFGWVYCQPASGVLPSAIHVRTWLREKDGIFWVSGKPGSGKSTFMKFIADEPRTRALLSEWSAPKPVVIASHYFWSAGTAMQRTRQGLLRTLLYEIFQQRTELISLVCGSDLSVPVKDEEIWPFPDLHAALRKIAAQQTLPVKFCFFVDGLDEYDPGPDGDFELCQALKDLAKSPHIKMCLSSRPWNVFEQEFGCDDPHSKLYIQDLTRNDILEYTRCRLYEHPRWPSLVTKEGPAQGCWLVEEIEKRASGVFLWVFLVTKLLREGLTNRDSFSDIRRRLESIPVELEVFFRNILDSVETFYHNKMATTLQIAIAAEEPLPVMAYDFHDQEYDDDEYIFSLPVKAFHQTEDAELKEEMTWRLNSRSRSLLEIHQASGTVTFLHRTVRDFLKTREMSDYLTEKAPSGYNVCLSLLKIYAAMVKRGQFDDPMVCYAYYPGSPPPLVSLTLRILDCVAELEGPSSSRNDLLFRILDELDRGLLVKFSQGQARISSTTEMPHPPEAFLRGILLQRRCMGYLSWKLPRDPGYMPALGPTIIPFIFTARHAFDFAIECKDSDIELFRLALETQTLDLNKHSGNSDGGPLTPWTWIMSQIAPMATSTAEPTGINIWKLLEHDIFSIMLRRGADPQAVIPSNHGMSGISVLAAYVTLSFGYPPTKTHEDLYLRELGYFLRAGATLNKPLATTGNMSLGLRWPGTIKIRTAKETFFNRMRHMSPDELKACSPRVLGEVAEMLLASVDDKMATVLARSIWPVAKIAFTAGVRERLVARYPSVLQTEVPVAHGLKRGADTELERDLQRPKR